MTNSLKSGLAISALLLSVGLSSCNTRADDPGLEYAPEMYDPIPYEALKQTGFNQVNAFGINQRTPPIATIPRGKLDYYTHIPKDSVGIAERTLRNPYPYTKENLLEGQVLYTRICAHCHGENGNGQGPVGIKYKGVPNYSQGEYKTMNDGHIYHVIQWGKNRMMPHGSIVNPEERWKIAMYVHVLQLNNDPADMPKLVRSSGGSKQSVEDSKVMERTNQYPVEEAQANKASETPGQGGAVGRNGSSI
jgi:mono/diheme cytochrome c family protein